MTAVFVLLYVPVLFSATNGPKFSLQSTDDARGAAEMTAWPNSVPQLKSQDPISLQPSHYQVDPYVNGPLLHYEHAGWSILIEPYRICLSEYSFGASQASSLLNQPLLNWNKLCCCHPLDSIASFVHPIPFISTSLLIVSLITFWVLLNIIILNGVWYIFWCCVKQINPLRLPIEKEPLHVGSTSSNSMLS